MTTDHSTAVPTRLGPLGRRLLAAFAAVALTAVLVLTVAALIGTDRGLVAAQRAERQDTATRASELVAAAYLDADGWAGIDLRPAQAVADAAGARLVVRGSGGRGGPGNHSGTSPVRAPVLVGDRQVGVVWLLFPADPAAGRAVAWSWIVGAAVVALLAAFVASWLVSRWLARPLGQLTAAASRFAAGDRNARSGVHAPGELGEVARAFDTMADEVVRAETVRRRLAADVAHELRTPLAGLRAGLEELRDGLCQPDTARLTGLHDQALRLGRVVDDLAELSAAESAALSLRLTELDLAELVRGTVAGQEPMLRAAGLELRVAAATSIPIQGDPDRLHQAVANLLSNSARYCPPGGWVSVSVSVQGEQAVIQVADTGPGIPPDELPHVFQRLWRGGGSGAVAGSGIGLAVVRELVAAHGGTVTAESPPGAGAEFVIRLPLRRGRAE